MSFPRNINESNFGELDPIIHRYPGHRGKIAMNNNDDKGFKVTDKRHAAQKGSLQEGTGDSESTDKERPESTPLPEVNFSMFILSLNTSVLVHLGEIPQFGSDKKEKDMPLAKHTIDTLAMLQEKTEGNLSKEEKGLLDHLLFDLRMKFVKASSS